MEDYSYEEVVVNSNEDVHFQATSGETEQKITEEMVRLNTQESSTTKENVYEEIDLSQYKPPLFQHDTELSGLTETQIKRRHVIKSLIDTEQSYIDCLDKLVNVCHPIVTSNFSSRPQVMKAFIYLRLMLSHHVKSQEKLKDGSHQNVINFFREFAEQEIVNLYSLYINSYSMAIEILKEAEKRKQAFRDFIKAERALSMEAFMLRPIQRFPQFILILKDLLKYTPDEDEEIIQLQDCLALLEHFGHQLNERKRRSEQMLQAQRIYNKLKLRPNADRGNHWLIRHDHVRQLSNETTGKQPTKERHLFLMNACLVSAGLSSSESQSYKFQWYVGLQHLDLKEKSMTPEMALKNKHEENTDNLSELNTLKDDYNTLEQMIDIAKTLKRSYPEVLKALQSNLYSVQQNIQTTLDTAAVELIDSSRNRTYTFLFDNSKTKQDWCTDFLISKYASDSSNNPAWSVQEKAGTDSPVSPACFISHLSADFPRQFTRVKCATQVIMPVSDNNTIGLPYLWVCSATEGLGKVSIISLHSGRPNLLESFKACQCEIVCAEMIPCFPQVQHELAFSMDTVWMGTAESEIIVFAVTSPQNVTRVPLHVFHTTEAVVTLKYIRDRVFAGCRRGNLLIFTRDKDGVWTESSSVVLGNSAVSSLVSWRSNIWIGCDKSVSIFEVDSLSRKPSVHLETEEESERTINSMVQIGHGLWVSYNGKAFLRLYHVDTGKLLQEYDASGDLSTFCAHSVKGYKEFQGSLKHEITSLMSCPGLLWVGTSSGIILNYPLQQNQDPGPKIITRPNVSMHGFCGSSKFFSIVPFGSVTSRSGPDNILDLHLTPMEHEETLYKRTDSRPTASDVLSTDNDLYISHVYMTLMPQSGNLPTVQEDCKISSSDTIQMQGNSEPRTGEDKPRISLVENVVGKSLISNNPFVLQDKSNQTLVKDQSQQGISKLRKSPKVVVDSSLVASSHANHVLPSTLDSRDPVGDDIEGERPELSKRRIDSGYGSAIRKDVNKLPSASSPNSLNRLLRVPSGGLKRQSALRKSPTQSTRSSVSSSRPISRSGSWKIQSTNTYVVISGGDGYKDWKNRQPIQDSNDEALLLAWIVKIYSYCTSEIDHDMHLSCYRNPTTKEGCRNLYFAFTDIVYALQLAYDRMIFWDVICIMKLGDKFYTFVPRRSGCDLYFMPIDFALNVHYLDAIDIKQ